MTLNVQINEAEVLANLFGGTQQGVTPPCAGKSVQAEGGLFNVFSMLQTHVEHSPRRLAFAQATGRDKSGRFLYSTRTYGQLHAEIEGMTRGLRSVGITKGSKTLVLVKPDLDLPVIVFSLFKIGAVPVIIDPAMGFKRLLACIRKVEPDAVIALPLIHSLRPFLGNVFRTVKTFISNGSAWMPATHRLGHLRHSTVGDAHTEATLATDLAAIFFTSGSTGTPKGVEVRHRNLGAQIEHFGAMFPVDPQDVELAAFPVATLIGPCLGQTSVIPDMGSMHPGRCNPHNLVQTIEDFGITSGFASPIVWERLSRHCVVKGVRLP
ncbi:MAG: AMP-binding protein, partial [Pseudomonadota bacterium]